MGVAAEEVVEEVEVEGVAEEVVEEVEVEGVAEEVVEEVEVEGVAVEAAVEVEVGEVEATATTVATARDGVEVVGDGEVADGGVVPWTIGMRRLPSTLTSMPTIHVMTTTSMI